MALSLCRHYITQKILQTSLQPCTQFVKFKSDAHIAMTDDTYTVVCWHPETHFPYELSLPLPKKELAPQNDSILKVQSNKEFLSVLQPKNRTVVIKELSKMTYTTKHLWFPPKRQFKRKPPVKPDRPYL